ncbi:hypothetical protein LSAT2_014470, partial [Lamellibrachia satsuma]
MSIFPATFEIISGGGHNCDDFSCFKVGESTCGSSANDPSRDVKSFGKVTSMYSPGEIVVLSAGVLSTQAFQTVEWFDTLLAEPYRYTVPPPKMTWHLAGRMVRSFFSVYGVPHSISASKFSTTRP